MTIDYTENGTVKFSMDEMIQECLGAFGESLESMVGVIKGRGRSKVCSGRTNEAFGYQLH
jgi:hypothetical protein